jgi:hypothetical protein
VPDRLTITCPAHNAPLTPLPGGDPAALYCPQIGCMTCIRVSSGEPWSPVSPLEQNAVMQHELVLSRQSAGFTRAEAMQILCAVIHASIIRGSGSG